MTASPKTETSSHSPRIVFLNFEITNDTVQQQYKIQLINKIVTEGKFKETGVSEHTLSSGDLIFLFFDQDSNELSRELLANPLNKTIEYVTEEGLLAKKSIKLASTQFSLRLQLVASAEYLEVKKYDGLNSDNISLLKIDILN